MLAGAASVYAQGQISLNNGPGSSGSVGIQIFASQSLATSPTLVTDGIYSGNELIGNSGDSSSYHTATGTPVAFTGSPLGAGYSVDLLIAAGTVNTYGALTEESGTVVKTWYTGSAATGFGGMFNGQANVSFGTVGQAVSVAIGAWNNEGGTITSLAAAQAAGDPWGVSAIAPAVMGGAPGTPSNLPTTLNDFSLVTTSPEPSTIALGVIGASSLLFRRKK